MSLGDWKEIEGRKEKNNIMLCYAFSFNPENSAKNYSQKKRGGLEKG